CTTDRGFMLIFESLACCYYLKQDYFDLTTSILFSIDGQAANQQLAAACMLLLVHLIAERNFQAVVV
ncbi:hypothetical protein ACJX0J_026722, partial [Zea mays]